MIIQLVLQLTKMSRKHLLHLLLRILRQLTIHHLLLQTRPPLVSIVVHMIITMDVGPRDILYIAVIWLDHAVIWLDNVLNWYVGVHVYIVRSCSICSFNVLANRCLCYNSYLTWDVYLTMCVVMILDNACVLLDVITMMMPY